MVARIENRSCLLLDIILEIKLVFLYTIVRCEPLTPKPDLPL